MSSIHSIQGVLSHIFLSFIFFPSMNDSCAAACFVLSQPFISFPISSVIFLKLSEVHFLYDINIRTDMFKVKLLDYKQSTKGKNVTTSS